MNQLCGHEQEMGKHQNDNKSEELGVGWLLINFLKKTHEDKDRSLLIKSSFQYFERERERYIVQLNLCKYIQIERKINAYMYMVTKGNLNNNHLTCIDVYDQRVRESKKEGGKKEIPGTNQFW